MHRALCFLMTIQVIKGSLHRIRWIIRIYFTWVYTPRIAHKIIRDCAGTGPIFASIPLIGSPGSKRFSRFMACQFTFQLICFNVKQTIFKTSNNVMKLKIAIYYINKLTVTKYFNCRTRINIPPLRSVINLILSRTCLYCYTYKQANKWNDFCFYSR